MKIDFATLAQLAEQDPCKVPVAGAIPAGGSNGTVPEWLKGKRCKRFDIMSTAVRICPVPPRAIITVS